jgi:subtilisin family serine protease
MTVPFPGRTGRGVRVAVIDSGVNASHPHIVSVAGGVTVGETVEPNMYIDMLGHGTAVMAAIQEKAPDAEYFAVRVFCSSLRTRVEFLLRALEWCIDRGVHVVNLSLGTANSDHAPRFESLVERAAGAGVILVSAGEAAGRPALPGGLPGVIAVGLDWDCPRELYRFRQAGERVDLFASGYPRSLPGMPKERNLHGVSFAVANMTGFVIRACEGLPSRTRMTVMTTLEAEAHRVMATVEP